MSDKVQWENFLSPKILRSNLIIASIYITAFEVLKTAIVGRIRDFYLVDFDVFRGQIGPKYQTEVLARNRSPVYASLEWLKESRVINDGDMTTFEEVKKLRNHLAHSLTQVLSEGPPSDLPSRFHEMISLLDKIERWWIINVDIATDSNFAGKEVDPEKVVPGPVMALQLMIQIALGSDDWQIEELIKQIQTSRAN